MAIFSKPKDGIIDSVIKRTVELRLSARHGSICEKHTAIISILVEVIF